MNELKEGRKEEKKDGQKNKNVKYQARNKSSKKRNEG